MKQLAFISQPQKRLQKEHGGAHSVGKRKIRRALALKQPLHVTLRSELAYGHRSLLKNKNIVNSVIRKFSKRFCIRIYKQAIVGNHLHLLVKGECRKDLQSFFRVLAGQIAQEILILYPLQKAEILEKRGSTPRGQRSKASSVRYIRKFWDLLLYSRIVRWGRDYFNVKNYILQNEKEALGLIAYKERTRKSLKALAAVMLVQYPKAPIQAKLIRYQLK